MRCAKCRLVITLFQGFANSIQIGVFLHELKIFDNPLIGLKQADNLGVVFAYFTIAFFNIHTFFPTSIYLSQYSALYFKIP